MATQPALTQPMSFEEWKAKAQENAAASGQQWYEQNAQSDYAAYKWHAEHPQGDSSVLGQTGSGTDEQRQTGQMKSGSFGDDSPDAGNASTGDPYIDELRSGRVAGSEDWRRFSNAQLKAWQPYYVGGGKFKNSYGDIVGKPIDSGPNTPSGYNGSGEQMGGGGGGGGGGGKAQPTEAVTRGKSGELSYTGNPMTDMLIYQFNNRNMLNNVEGPNVFGALDNREAGTIDKTTGERTMPEVTGQMLSGGGLWWTGADKAKETFAGYGAKAPKATGPGASDLYDKGTPVANPVLDQPLMTTPEQGGKLMPGEPGVTTPGQQMLLNKRKQGYFGGEYTPPPV